MRKSSTADTVSSAWWGDTTDICSETESGSGQLH